MTVTLINPFEVAPEQEAAFFESWKQTAAVFSGKAGYRDTRLHRSLDAKERFRFVNIAHWDSADTWAAAMTTFPPQEGGMSGVHANPALYVPIEGGSVEARNGAIEIELRDLEERLAQAYRQNDATFLSAVLADDYLVTDGPGTTSDKAKVLDDHAGKRLRVSAFRFDEMHVGSLGSDAAFVTGRYTWDAAYDGHPIAGTFRFLRVYARSNGNQWQIRAGQVTPVRQVAA